MKVSKIIKCSVCGTIFNARFDLVSLDHEKELVELISHAKCGGFIDGKTVCLREQCKDTT